MNANLSNINSSVRTIGPVEATEMLKHNKSNRRVREWWVNELASIMRRGEFMATHQGIAFDSKGNLQDGQHRLMAIIRANIAVPLQVTYGVSPSAFYALDRGVKRDMSDALGFDRRVIDPCLFALRAAIGGRPTPPQVERVLMSPFGERANELMVFCGTKPKLFGSAVFRATCVIQILRRFASPQYAFETYRQLVTRDFNNMTPFVAACYRQLETSSTRYDPELTARALAVFDESKQLTTRLVVTSQAVSVAHLTFRETLEKVNAI
jgi:hypothetical protein